MKIVTRRNDTILEKVSLLQALHRFALHSLVMTTLAGKKFRLLLTLIVLSISLLFFVELFSGKRSILTRSIPVQLRKDHSLNTPVQMKKDHSLNTPVQLKKDHSLNTPVQLKKNHSLNTVPVQLKIPTTTAVCSKVIISSKPFVLHVPIAAVSLPIAMIPQ